MNSLDIALKLLIKDAIFEALDEYTTKIPSGVALKEGAVTTEPGQPKKRAKRDAVAEQLPQEGGQALMPNQASFAVANDKPAATAAPVVDTGAEYKKIQAAVIKLVNMDGGKDKVVKVLDQFGVATALKLDPSQYAEALKFLEDAAAEEPLA